MKKNLVLLIFIITSSFSFSQTVNYWVTFKDKNNSPYHINDPKAFLSERSIARRERQHILITEKDLPVNPVYINGLIKVGVILKNRSKWFNAVSITLNDERAIEIIKSLPYVKSVKKIDIPVSLNHDSKFDLETTSPITQISQKHSEQVSSFDYGSTYNQAHMIGADCMHDQGFLGQGIVIAQFDAGFYKANVFTAFDSMRANNQILGCRDFVTGDTMVFEDASHGMSVLSCMAGNIPGSIIGTAPKAKFWLLRTEDDASESWQEEINWAVAAEFADSVGADIISSSLGYSTGMTNPAQNHTFVEMDGNTTIVTKAADWAASVGIFVSSSAGNSGGSPWYKITAPADADSILTVGAVDPNGIITSFSSRGLTYDGRIKPDVVAQGGSSVLINNTGAIAASNGTSFSCPITSGAVACLWQAHPTKTNMEILDAIQKSSSQYSFPDSIKGYGIPNFCVAHRILSPIVIPEDESFSVYPNPSSSDFQISIYSLRNETASVDLYDISGRRVVSQSCVLTIDTRNNFKIGTDNLSNGIYILKVVTKSQTYFTKLVKSKN